MISNNCQAYHFDRDDVALEGTHKFFKEQSEEERGHAMKLMKLQNTRGGRIVLDNIQKPRAQDWGSGVIAALEEALQLEKDVNQSLLELHKAAADKDDAQVLQSHN